MPAFTVTKTTVGLNMTRDGYSGAQSPKITYVAIGSGATTPTAADTKLVTELFRKAVTAYVNGGATGEILISMYLAPGDSVGTSIQEIGFFGGNASGTKDSGVLVARGLWAHGAKSALESITFTLDNTFS